MDNIELSDMPVPKQQQQANLPEGNLSLLEMLSVLSANRRFIILFTIICIVLGAVGGFALHPTFTATAVIMPPQQQQSSLNSMMGQLGSLASLSGGGSSLLKNPADIYVGILESRTIADRIINRYGLQEVYKVKMQQDARKVLEANVSFAASKNGLINLAVKDHDPRRASEIANSFIDELYHMNSLLAISEASQRRVFFDQQLTEEKKALVNAEDDLKSTQQTTGLIEVSGQEQLILRNIAQVRAQIASREVELQAMRSFATEQNPELTRLQGEVATLRQQLSGLESTQAHTTPGSTEVSSGNVPAAGLEYIRKLREVKYHETLFELLSKQYEAARIDEAKSAPIIQIIDRAVPPERKSGPPRLLIMLGTGVFGFCTGCCWSFARHAWIRYISRPENALRVQEIITMGHKKN